MTDKRMKKAAPKKQTSGPARQSDYGFFVLIALLIFFWIAFVAMGTFQPLSQTITGVDPVGYYAWVHSVLFDFDLDFHNEYQALNPEGAISGDILVDPNGPRTATGHLPNAFSIGPGLLWAPFLILGHAYAYARGYHTDGFSQPYFAAVAYANMIYAWLGVLLLYYALRTWFRPAVSLVATIAAWACSPALYYTYGQEAVSHDCSLFSVALLLFLWARLRRRDEWWVWAIIGASVGLAILVRWQNITFAALVAVDLLWRDQIKNIPKMIASGIASVLVFLPQMIGWKILYGSMFTIPQGGAFMDWAHPNLIKLFFSPEYGLITWTPLCALGMAGLFFIPKDRRRIFVAILVAFLIQLYVGAVAGNVGWSFGMRRMINCIPLFAVGYALLMTRFAINLKMAVAVVALFAFWNFLFALQYGGILDPYYVQTALSKLAGQQGISVEQLAKSDRLPDGTPFDLQQFAQTHRFPRDTAPSFSQFVPDKLRVIRAIFTRLLLIGT